MKRHISPWTEAVKIEMIRRRWSMRDLAKAVGLSYEYTCAIVNGRVISPAAIKNISNVLDVQVPPASTA